MLVEYIIHKPTWKFGTMGLIPDGPNLGHLDVSPVIDFYKPRSCAGRQNTFPFFSSRLLGVADPVSIEF
jgi:hypothetical protein